MAAAHWPNTTAGSMNSNKLSKFLLTPLLALLAFTAHADVPGYTEPYKTITVSAAEAGVIKELPVEEGTVVKQGQILARLDVAQLDAELEIAKIKADFSGQKWNGSTNLPVASAPRKRNSSARAPT